MSQVKHWNVRSCFAPGLMELWELSRLLNPRIGVFLILKGEDNVKLDGFLSPSRFVHFVSLSSYSCTRLKKWVSMREDRKGYPRRIFYSLWFQELKLILIKQHTPGHIVQLLSTMRTTFSFCLDWAPAFSHYMLFLCVC